MKIHCTGETFIDLLEMCSKSECRNCALCRYCGRIDTGSIFTKAKRLIKICEIENDTRLPFDDNLNPYS